MNSGSRFHRAWRWTFASIFVVSIVVTGFPPLLQQVGPTSPPSDSFPPGTSASGVDNVSRLVGAHQMELTEAGTYEAEHRITASRPEGRPRPDRWKWNQTASLRYDLGSSPPQFVQQRRVVRPDTEMRMQVFATPSVWYTRSQSERDQWTVDEKRRNLTAAAFRNWALNHGIESSLSTFEFTYVGRDELGNTTVYRFRSSEYLGDRQPGPRSLPNTITDATATILVDEDGLIHEFERRYVGFSTASTANGSERVNVSVSYTWQFERSTGSPVREPDWASTRREDQHDRTAAKPVAPLSETVNRPMQPGTVPHVDADRTDKERFRWAPFQRGKPELSLPK